ncbi:MAG: hypothetical protein WCK78_01920 [Paludibacter sp.]
MKKLIHFLFFAIVLATCDACDTINPPDPPQPPVIKYYTIKALYNTNMGTVSPKDTTIEKGKNATFKITPDAGYLIDYIKDDGNILPGIDTYTVRNVSENDTFEVAFKKDSILYPLLNYTWYQDSLVSILIDEVLYYYFDDSNLFNFNPNGDFEKLQGKYLLKGEWSLLRNYNPFVMKIFGEYHSLEFISDDRMVTSYVNSQGHLHRFTYTNKGNKIVLQ